ncbi:N-acetylmuramoyl-L-alanine amidase [Actinobacillus equuli]|uniref:N-acetylmuramoyl-L-alanine amidase n=1 Tax=Actinobacillus equuli TaxID=718 RepID=UPI002446712D|nr:N-acetylmuramoyl-L-alanine amidase [Actinobacillus equuli]WGE82537.1 N-acetylmuramoyl-L-alanine amidase [Actinobacillus equuli subsp. equuli]
MNKLVNYIAVSLFGLFFSLSSYAKTVVVIDAGHGGKDPGAIGATLGIKEKNVTLAISKELKALLDSNPKFKAVMTRKSDYFIQLPERTEIARKNKANLLVSIHADSSPKSNSLKGASVWVLSNRRASDEMGKWLEDHEKQSELLGGAGSVLSNTNEKYLNQTVLDLQFSHSQRSGYELGKTVLSRLGNVTSLAKSAPQHASLSVLRSPDITSILVETGFLSNPVEEQKLATPAYRRKIAQAIYNGLVAYVSRHSGNPKAVYKEVKEEKKGTAETNKKEAKEKKSEATSEKSSVKANSEKELKTKKETKRDNSKTKVEEKSAKDNKNSSKDKEQSSTKREPQKSSNGYHIVQQDETLYSIARIYNTTPEQLSKLNNIKNNKITVGKKLKVQ